jgi:hypothetical protein
MMCSTYVQNLNSRHLTFRVHKKNKIWHILLLWIFAQQTTMEVTCCHFFHSSVYKAFRVENLHVSRIQHRLHVDFLKNLKCHCVIKKNELHATFMVSGGLSSFSNKKLWVKGSPHKLVLLDILQKPFF